MKREWLKQTERWTSGMTLIHLQCKLEGAHLLVALPQLVEAQALKPLTDLHHCHLQTPHLQMYHLRIHHLPTMKAKVPNPSGIREETEPEGEDRTKELHRRAWRDDGDNPHSPHDWSNFDIGKVVRMLRTDRQGHCALL